MIIQKECIIGFSKSVKFEDPEAGNGFAKNKFIRVEGPGIVLIESGP